MKTGGLATLTENLVSSLQIMYNWTNESERKRRILYFFVKEVNKKHNISWHFGPFQFPLNVCYAILRK